MHFVKSLLTRYVAVLQEFLPYGLFFERWARLIRQSHVLHGTLLAEMNGQRIHTYSAIFPS